MSLGVSLNGWVVPSPKTVTLTIPGTTRRVTLDKDAAPVLVALAADYHKTIRPIDQGTVDDGGVCIRPARAANGYSNHASGSALDLNWSQEGNGKGNFAKTFWADVKHKAAIAVLKRRYGKVVQWGGDWSAAYWDPMHFEIRPNTSRGQVRAFAAQLGINDQGVRKGA